jgi:predicted nucleic acid-binding protein
MIVVDASAIVAILFEEPSAIGLRNRIEGTALAAPSLLAFEIANACVTRERRHPTQHESASATYAIFSRLDIDLMPVELGNVVRLARTTGLTAYDATYLWLARHLQCELVTLDRRLQAAASATP